MSYKDLEVWQMARELVIDIHRMRLETLARKMNRFIQAVELQHNQ